MTDTECPVMPPLFDKALGELGNEDAEVDTNSDQLDMVEIQEGDSTFSPQHSNLLVADVAPSADSDFSKVCKRAAAKLKILWPASKGSEDWSGTCMRVKRQLSPHLSN